MKHKKWGVMAALLIAAIVFSSMPVAAEGVFNSDGTFNQQVFDRDWRKYSDLDDAVPFESKSWQAQRYYETIDRMEEIKTEIYLTQRDMELDRFVREELRNFDRTLKQELKTNLLRAFWRLAYITQGVVQGGVSAAKSYRQIMALDLRYVKDAYMAVGRGVVMLEQLNSAIDDHTQSVQQRTARSLAVGSAEFLATFFDPKKAALSLYEKSMDQIQQAALPTANITEEDCAILKEQYVKTRALDAILELSYLENRERRLHVQKLEAELRDLASELSRWEAEEKERVFDMLLRTSVDTEDDSPQTPGATDGTSAAPEGPIVCSGSFDLSSWGAEITQNSLLIGFDIKEELAEGQGTVVANYNYDNGMTSTVTYELKFEGGYDPLHRALSGTVTVNLIATVRMPDETTSSYTFSGDGKWSADIGDKTAKGVMKLPPNQYGPVQDAYFTLDFPS